MTAVEVLLSEMREARVPLSIFALTMPESAHAEIPSAPTMAPDVFDQVLSSSIHRRREGLSYVVGATRDQRAGAAQRPAERLGRCYNP